MKNLITVILFCIVDWMQLIGVGMVISGQEKHIVSSGPNIIENEQPCLDYKQSFKGCILLKVSSKDLTYEYRVSFAKEGIEPFNFINTDAFSHALSLKNNRQKSIGIEDKESFTKIINKTLNGEFTTFLFPWEWSHNRKKIAITVRERKKHGKNDKYWYTNKGPYRVVVIDVPSMEVIFKKTLKDKDYVNDLTWDPLSESLAILVASSKTGLKPWELLGAIAGHPVPYISLYLEVLDISSGFLLQYQVVKDVKYGTGYIFWVE